MSRLPTLLALVASSVSCQAMQPVPESCKGPDPEYMWLRQLSIVIRATVDSNKGRVPSRWDDIPSNLLEEASDRYVTSYLVRNYVFPVDPIMLAMGDQEARVVLVRVRPIKMAWQGATERPLILVAGEEIVPWPFTERSYRKSCGLPPVGEPPDLTARYRKDWWNRRLAALVEAIGLAVAAVLMLLAVCRTRS